MNTRIAIRILVTLAAVVLLWAFLISGCRGQDGAQSVLEQQHAAGTLEPIPLTTAWQEKIQAELDAAGAIAKAGWGKTVVVTIPPQDPQVALLAIQPNTILVAIKPVFYEFVSLVIPPNVILCGGHGLGVEADLVYVGGGDVDAITLRAGYSTGLAGIRLRCRDLNVPRVVGIKVDDVLNGLVENIRVDLRGVDTIGLQIAGRESLTIRRLESRASVPIQYIWGDNVLGTSLDLGASGNVHSLPSTVLDLVGLPHQISLDGSWQGGDHAVFSVTDAKATGQGLLLNSVRYEQSTSTNDPTKYAIDIRCNGRTFEMLTLVNCRWTQRKAGISIVRNPAYPLATKVTLVGCWLPGSQ